MKRPFFTLLLSLSLSACGQGPANYPSTSTSSLPVRTADVPLDFSKGETSGEVPALSYVSKSSYLFGNLVFITGSNFTGTTQVSFNGNSVDFSVLNDGTLFVDLPNNVNLSSVNKTSFVVTNAYGSSNQNSTTENTSALSLSPGTGAIFSTVVITGSGLTGATAVSFNGTAATYTVDSDTQITAQVPIGATDGTITVTTPSASQVSSAFDVSNKILFVDNSRLSPSQTSDGTSWSKAYTDLQSALSSATAGDVIWVAEGSYKPTQGTDRKLSFTLDKNISVYGGFAGNESTLGARNWQTHPTILSGDLNGDDTPNFSNLYDNSYHVVTVQSQATLDGFQIKSGYSQYVSPADSGLVTMQGGGLYCLNASPTLKNLVFSANGSDKGGAMAISGTSSAIISQVAFYKNVAGYGGGLHVNGGAALILSNAVFSGNVGSTGGGMYISNASASLNHVTFASNLSAEVNVGFSGDAQASAALRNVLFWDNSLDATNGIFTQSGSVTAVADPHTLSSDPDGADNRWFTADDGLQLKDSLSTVLNLGVSSDLSSDSLGNPRVGTPDPGAYEDQ